jgi:hypothetical protein
VKAVLLDMLKPYGIVDEDIKWTSMGASGVDLQFSPAAQKYTPWKTEVKRVEKLNVVTTFFEHFAKYKAFVSQLKILFHRRNHQEWLVTLRLSDFVEIYSRTLPPKG